MDVTVSTDDGGTVIHLTGRFDAHEAATFRKKADLSLATTQSLAVDLSAVVFIDSTALAELVQLSRVAGERGVAFGLRFPSVPVRVILELTGLDVAFAIEEAASEVEQR